MATRDWQRELTDPGSQLAQRELERSGPRCDECQGLAVVMVDAHHTARFRSFRCAVDAMAVLAHFANNGVGIDRLEWLGAHPQLAGVDIAAYVRKTFDGAIGDATLPFATADDARLNVEMTLRPRLARDFDPAELATIRIGVLIEWKAQEERARAERYQERAEWLQDYQAGRVP